MRSLLLETFMFSRGSIIPNLYRSKVRILLSSRFIFSCLTELASPLEHVRTGNPGMKSKLSIAPLRQF